MNECGSERNFLKITSFAILSFANSQFRIKSTNVKISSFCKVHVVEKFKLHVHMILTQFSFLATCGIFSQTVTHMAT